MVVGLGNPGPEHEQSRHNVGFLAVEALARRAGVAIARRRYRSLYARGSLQGRELLLIKPLTYMNDSGAAVGPWSHALGVEPGRIIVIHDDLDLPISRLKVRVGGGDGGHKGVRSILEALRRADFIRIKVGIGRPPPGRDPVEHVLQPFEPAERDEIGRAIEQVADAVEAILRDGVQAAMTRFNVRTAPRQRGERQAEGGV